MEIQIEILKKWYFFIPTIIAITSLCWSIFNSIIGRIVTNKIFHNDLKHLTEDVKNLKEKHEELQKQISNDIRKIFLGISRVERKQVKRDTICDERHLKEKK